MAFVGDQNIFRFQLSINYIVIVKDFQSHDNLGDQSFDDIFPENTGFLFQIIVDITSGKVLHDNVDFALVLEGLVNSNEEIVLAYFFDDLALQEVHLLDFFLLDDFHCVLFTCLFVFGQHNITERAFTEILDRLIIVGTSTFLWL